jgi:hypothetical protein
MPGLVPGIHVLQQCHAYEIVDPCIFVVVKNAIRSNGKKAWMAGTSPAMTTEKVLDSRNDRSLQHPE